MRRLERATLALAALLAIGGAAAGPSATVQVGITLARASGACVSGSSADTRVALVQVTCAAGEFVAIRPAARSPNAQGVAQRYAVGGVETAWMQRELAYLPWGTITALRVVDLDRQRLPIEMLVSF